MDVETYVRDNILITGEQIAWRGRPNPGRVLKREIKRAVFGFLFMGFAIFWTVSAAARDGLVFSLFGLPFSALGSWLASSPLRQRMRAANTYYAVTNERALIIETGKNVRTTSIAPDDITDLERVDRADGSGDLRFRLTRRRGRYGHRVSADFADGFWGTDDIKGAATAIKQLPSTAERPVLTP